MENKPFFTIVTPVYNGEKYIEKCILSIKNQTYTNFEHIIMDGGSTDNTLHIVRKYEGTYNLKIFSQKDNGMYDAIAQGFNYASGNIFSWLNADDMYMPWALETLSKVFSQCDVKWCIGHPGFWDEFGNYRLMEVLPVYNRKLIQKGIYDGRLTYNIQQESTFWTKKLWEESGAENIIKKYACAGDFYLWKLFANYESLYSINVPVSGFRVHKGQKSEVERKRYYEEVGNLGMLKRKLRKYKILKLFQKIESLFSKNIIRIQELRE